MSITLKKASVIGVAIATVVWLSGAAMLIPVASAQSTDATIQQLLVQIAALQAQLVALQGGSSTAYSFTRDLTEGVSGADVTALQNYLTSTGHFTHPTATGFFGSITKAAVAAWQAANGVAPAVGYFGSISKAKYTSLIGSVVVTVPTTPTTPTVPVTITTPGAEGSVTAKYAASPVTGQNAFANSANVGAVGLEVKATNSDVVVNRLDVKFSSRPWLYMSRLTVADGSTSVKTVDVTSVNTIETTVGTNYTVRAEGLNILVSKDQTKTINVWIDPILPAGETEKTLTYEIIANAFRATDGAGLTQNAPVGALGARTVVIKTGDVASLEVSENSSNPNKGRNVLVSETATTEGILALVLDVKSKSNGSYVREVHMSSTYPTSSVLKLYDGSTLLKSITQAATDVNNTFDDLSVFVAKDATKTFTLRVDIPKQTAVAATVTANSGVTGASNTIVAEDATTFATVNVTGSNVTSGLAYLADKAPTLALVSASMSAASKPSGALDGSNTSQATFTIRVNVTANGGDIYVASNTLTASSGVLATATPVASMSFLGAATSLISGATETTDALNWKVSNGATNYFEVAGTVVHAGNPTDPAQFARALLYSIGWGVSDATADRTVQTWGLDDLKTGEVQLLPTN